MASALPSPDGPRNCGQFFDEPEPESLLPAELGAWTGNSRSLSLPELTVAVWGFADQSRT